MRKSLLSIIFTAVLVWNAAAQGQADHAEYEIIRETINFLATDTRVSRDTGFRISCETLDYDCFKQQLSANTIAGIERWYNSWRSAEVTDEAALAAFRDQVLKDILDRPGKGYRRELAGYEGYISRIERLIQLPVDGIPAVQADTNTTETAAVTPPGWQPTAPADPGDQPETPKTGSNTLAYIAVFIGLLALALAAWQLFNKRVVQPDGDVQDLREHLNELSARIRRLEHQPADSRMADAVASLTDIMESIEKRVVELENNSGTL